MKNLNITKQVLLLLLMIIGGGSLKAQNDSTYVYQSFFGNDSTRINIYDSHVIDAAWTFVASIYNSDTVNINGTSYYKTNGGDYYYSDLYYREDIETGRLYQYVEEYDTEVLICDMSLNIGDTFHFQIKEDFDTIHYNPYWEPAIGVVTDVRYEDGKKIIEFDEESSWFLGLDTGVSVITFTEGEFPVVIPTVGLFQYNELLCQFKDGEHTYHNPSYEECYYKFTSVEEIESKSITIVPTIFSNNETISIESDYEIKDVKMLYMLGREINISINPMDDFTSQISLNQGCNSGIYLIIVKTEKEVYYEKVILRD